MNVKDFTKPEIEYLLDNCNFVGLELKLFKLRTEGHTLEEIAEILDISYSYSRKISRKVNNKIIKVS